MATTLGTAIIWGCNGTAATITGLGALTLIEGRDHSSESDKEEIRDKDGNVKSVTYYNNRENASLRFAVAQTIVSLLPTPGSYVTLVDANYIPVAKPWIMDKVSTAATNTKALMATLDLLDYVDGGIPA